MKRLLLGLLGMLVFTSLGASIKWDWETSVETYDFESGGFYYGIISELRGEVQVMNKIPLNMDPYPSYWELPPWPEYRTMLPQKGEECGEWIMNYYEGDIEIPSVVAFDGKDYTVVRVGYGAFAWNEELTSVKLPATIREIRYGAFSMCGSLADINIPDGTRVCGGAFYGCGSLKKLDFSKCEFQYNAPADKVVCQCVGLEEIYLPAVWYSEPFQCYVEEVKESYVEHHRLGDYHTEYDDFPYIKCNGDGHNPYWPASTDAQKYRQVKGDDGAEIGDYYTNAIELIGCVGLRKIHATSVVPLELHGLSQGVDGYWDFLYEDCVLYVPEGSLEAYSSTAPWSNFKHILEETQTSVDVVPVAGFESAAPRRIYDLSGNLRATLSSGEIPELAPGLYIERCGSVSKKVVVM